MVPIVVFLICLITGALSSDNGLGALPPMGWNTWCTDGSCGRDVCYESEIKEVALAMKANGMQAAGYNYVNLDDCWAAETRDKDGNIQPDPSRFPSGIAELVSWLHDKGFKFGLYTSAGIYTCSHGERPLPIPGSYGHYKEDALTFAKWDVDYVKLDWCATVFPNGTRMDQQTQTNQFYDAMNATGKPMWLNFHCGDPPQTWCQRDGNSYRIGPDHHDNWSNTIQCINALKGLAKTAGPKTGWNDPDFLETAGQGGCGQDHCPGQTPTEYRTVFSLWSIASAPLIVATDVRNLTALQKEILLNTELIAVDQDRLAIGGGLIGTWACDGPKGVCEIWGKPLYDGSYVVGLFNSDIASHSITLDFNLIGKKGQVLKVRDLWQHRDLGTFTGSYSTVVMSHETVVIKLSV
eukprot:TRINITY_DN2618_c0_g1_i1.p1 TRINITY_DN2618_c0_g1~~TRINITY_DN2618_c0_g1_i1.p1  ORF type:complete len:428 (-),score=90.71 TRINITY_DN2618_c0_g1_i1:96-1316(-)